MDWFGLSTPIVQAPMGSIANVDLVVAVANGGGLGSMAMTWTPRDEGLAAAATLKTAGIPFFFNFVVEFRPRKMWPAF